jgi:two-component system response regulator RpfG
MKTLTSKPLTLVHDSHESKLAPLKVLIVDDQSTGRIVLSEIMRSLDPGLEVVTFADPIEAIEFARTHPVDMVLTDYKMPGMDGIEAIRRLRRIFGYEDIPIVCITVVNDREVRYRALDAGATDFLIRPIDRLECGARCKNLLSLRRHEILKKNRTRILEQKIDEATRELRRREVDTLFRLAKAAEQRDKVTGMHLVRMAKYSALIAKGAGLSSAEQDAIELAAPMHDIGKIGIPDRILQNPGKLEGEDLLVMQSHARIGYDMLKDSSSGYLQMAAVIALGHHEKYNGSGYPTGLRGEHIPLEARIVAVADVYDALTSVRPYKAAWSAKEALAYMESHAGRHFDPRLVEVVARNCDEVISIGERFADQLVP